MTTSSRSGAQDRNDGPTARPRPVYAGRVSERQGHDDEVLPEQTSDDTDNGWGDRHDEDELSDDERLIREKPPHW